MLVTSKRTLIVIVGCVFLLYALSALESEDEGADESWLNNLKRQLGGVMDKVLGNARLTKARVNAAGVVLDTVPELQAQASEVVGYAVSADALTLSRAIASEAGKDDTVASRLYRCHVIINLASRSGLSVTNLALKHTSTARNGHYGKQIGGAFATSKDSYAEDLTIAQLALTQRGLSQDPTGGAFQFSDKHGFGVQAGTSEWEEHVAVRKGEGKTGANLPDAPKSLVFWYKGFLPGQATKAV